MTRFAGASSLFSRRLSGPQSAGLLTILVAVLVMLIWGSSYVPMKVGLRTFPPLLFAGLRFLGPGVILTAAVWLRGRRLRDASLRALVVLGLFQTGFFYAALFFGLQYVPAGTAATLVNGHPFVAALLAYLFLDERLSSVNWLGLVVGFAGVAVISWEGRLGSESHFLLGVGVLLTGTLSWAVGTVIAKHMLREREVLTVTAGQSLIGSVFILVVSGVVEGDRFGSVQWNLDALASLAYLILVSSALASFLWYWALSLGQASRLSAFFFLIPASSFILSWLLLGERFTALVVGGLGLIGWGIYMTNRKAVGWAVERTTPPD